MCKGNFRSSSKAGIMSAWDKWIQKELFVSLESFSMDIRAEASLGALALRALHHVG